MRLELLVSNYIIRKLENCDFDFDFHSCADPITFGISKKEKKM
jgi:hypothetical protein